MGCEGKSRSVCCFGKDLSPGAHGWGWGLLPQGPPGVRATHTQTHLPKWLLTLDDKALPVNMLLICNFENKIETSCILKYKMKCDALYTI